MKGGIMATPKKPTAAGQGSPAPAPAPVSVSVSASASSISHDAYGVMVDRHFADLVQNVPALRQTENHNETIKVREALKIELTKKEEEA